MTEFSADRKSSPDRRSFLQTTSAAGALACLPALHLPRRTQDETPIMGEGEWQYQVFHNWVTLPEKHTFGGASHGVCIDSENCFHISHHGSPGSVFVFDPDGKFVRSYGEQFQGAGHGIDIRMEDEGEFVYLSPDDDRSGFAKLDMRGELVWQKTFDDIRRDSGRYEGESARFRATNCSFSPDGGVFLGDGYGSSLIHQYDAAGKFVRTIGEAGSEPGQFRTPHGQWLDDRDGTPKLAVCDRANARLQFFDMEGKHLSILDGFLFPADIDIRGEVMLVPDLHCRLTLLGPDNQVLVQLGDSEEWRKTVLADNAFRAKPELWRPGKFIHPHDACFDSDGNIIVTEWVEQGRVSRLVKV